MKRHRFVVHVCDMHGHGERYDRARASWEHSYADADVIECLKGDWPRTAQEIGDTRNLPALHDVLNEAVAEAPSDEDVIVFSNSDNGFAPGAFAKFRDHAAVYGAFSIRRDASHIGRDVFGFTRGWLKSHLHLIPEFWCGAPAWDLVLAAIIRKDRGIKTTKANLMVDFFPCELAPGLVTHESHESAWAGANEHRHPANLVNLSLARRWASENAVGPIV